jgi:CheY-like chemotaxis protein
VHSPLTHSLLLQQQQQQQFGGAAVSSPYSSSAAAAAAVPGEAAMPLLRGKRVLLVEPCKVIRSVLALALRSWGCFVCAVSSEAAAMQRLVLNGTLHLSPGSAAAILAEAEAADSAAAAAAGSSSSSSGVLQLQHAPDMDERKFCCNGPYDCVLLDMHHTR